MKDKTQWLTVSGNGTTCSIYVNGQLTKSFQDVAPLGEKKSISGYSVTLGNSRSVKGPWTGGVLGLRVYQRALTESEIANDRDGGRQRVSNEKLIAFYRLEKSRSTFVPDLSGNKNMLSVPEQVALTNSILAWPD